MSGCLQECVRAEYTNKRLVSTMTAPWDPKDNGTQVRTVPILHYVKSKMKSQVRQCLCFCTADLWSSLAYVSAEHKLKHCIT